MQNKRECFSIIHKIYLLFCFWYFFVAWYRQYWCFHIHFLHANFICIWFSLPRLGIYTLFYIDVWKCYSLFYGKAIYMCMKPSNHGIWSCIHNFVLKFQRKSNPVFVIVKLYIHASTFFPLTSLCRELHSKLPVIFIICKGTHHRTHHCS